MGTIAAPVRGYFRRTSSPPPPQIGFQNKTPLSSQRAISDIEDAPPPVPATCSSSPITRN
ncbi:hypothetical protein DPMN_016677 [Dreissena polymorpha]|uniref:Uncharacterized protein n=1 Tax=Dreissena polymorpha TaxID=45954 RepID=A0A9D4S6S0_DREPO|nr:hypothetical protein DPMN_016677 [Dreissena polymorpha]